MSSKRNLKLNLNLKLANGWHIPYVTYEFSQWQWEYTHSFQFELFTETKLELGKGKIFTLFWLPFCGTILPLFLSFIQSSFLSKNKIRRQGQSFVIWVMRGCYVCLVYGLYCFLIRDVAAISRETMLAWSPFCNPVYPTKDKKQAPLPKSLGEAIQREGQNIFWSWAVIQWMERTWLLTNHHGMMRPLTLS